MFIESLLYPIIYLFIFFLGNSLIYLFIIYFILTLYLLSLIKGISNILIQSEGR